MNGCDAEAGKICNLLAEQPRSLPGSENDKATEIPPIDRYKQCCVVDLAVAVEVALGAQILGEATKMPTRLEP